MMENQQLGVWEKRAKIGRNEWFDENDEIEDQQRLSRGGYASSKCCCCPCSLPILMGLLIGVLVAGIALATALSIHFVNARETTSMIQSITNTFTTVTTSTVTTSNLTSSTSSSSTSVSTSSTTSFSTSASTSSTTSSSTSVSTSTTTSSSTSVSTSSTTSSSTSVSTSTTSVTSSTVSTTTSVTTTTATTTTTTVASCTTRVTFDDIPGQSSTSGVIPNGYNNLNWTNSFYLNASSAPFSGFQVTAISPPFVGYNPGGSTVRITTANGTRFAFTSIVVNSAWRDNLTWSFILARAGVNIISVPRLLQPVNRTVLNCGSCTNMDSIIMSSSGGYPRSDMSQNGTEFSFDNLCISFGY